MGQEKLYTRLPGGLWAFVCFFPADMQLFLVNLLTIFIRMRVQFKQFDNGWYDPGHNRVIRTLWYFVNALFFLNPLIPSSRLKILLLRMFSCKIGVGVVLKPRINIKYPWNVSIGDYTWIGEGVWLDSLAQIKIGSNVCVSQGVYLCTGNHDWTDPGFGLVIKPITIEDGAWIGARANILPGVTISSHAVISSGMTVSKNTEPFRIYVHSPRVVVKERIIRKSKNSPGASA